MNKLIEIEKREKALFNLPKTELKAILIRSCRIISLDEQMDKWGIISGILEAEYGRKFVTEFYKNIK